VILSLTPFDAASILIVLAAILGYVNFRFLHLPQSVGLTVMGAVASLLIVGVDRLLPDARVGVSVLYMLMFSPAVLSMSAQADGLDLPSTMVGESRFKSKSPSRFCDIGLFSLIRFPNYFGEMVFWLGVWASGISAYRSWAAWALATLGFILIQLVMLSSSRRLEQKQGDRYTNDPAFAAYIKRVPVLFPWVRLYSLRRLKVYLG
jgi:protein-S-isoprenylcysteine O-methyltransferase Ste14